MLHLRLNIYQFVLIAIVSVLVSCSAERKNVISKAYHNTTAHFNAYFYAKERIEEIEAILDENYDNDYNQVLMIYPTVDSTLASSYQTQIDDCIKKASIAIQRHQNSKWVDDSYILIGQARYYSLDYVNAIDTYKFVNTKSEDDDARHNALIHLLRTFTDAGEYNNAIEVSDYLKKEKINQENSKLLYINKAYFYQVQGDYDNMVQNLVKAAPLLHKKDGKGRLYFIIGQIYQMLGFDAEAFNYYKKCIASNPAYELDFYARLYMAQVTELNKSSDVKAARKLFQKLLKDKKNKEFKDKIYYEMAEFEAKRNNLEEAIEYYNASVQASVNNNRQKGQSYHKLGVIYYDSLREYETAKAYYDSTVSTLPADYEGLAEIKQRQEILAEFVMQITTINLQDSLLRLSRLDTAPLRRKLENIVAQEEAKKKEEQEKAEKKAAARRRLNQNTNTGISGASWYFGNPSAVSLGQNEFKRIWGDRPLEDNWRRSIKESTGTTTSVAQQQTEQPNQTDEAQNQSVEESSAARVEQMMARVPRTEEAKKAANTKIEMALYKLGNIYNFDLNEEKNALTTFVNLLNRYPNSEYEPEVLYQLYLITKNLNDPKQATFKNQLISKYPNTTYAKLLANPNYTEESTEANEQQKKVYKEAFTHYERGNYNEAIQLLNGALREYQETIFTPRLKLLKILITGKTQDINLYQYQLDEFIKINPDSDITPYAQKLLEASRNFQSKQQKLLGTEFIRYFDQDHYFVLIYESSINKADQFARQINTFNDMKFPDLALKTSNLILDDTYTMILVSDLEGKEVATSYYSQYLQNDVISEKTQNAKFHKFVITKDNFNILYQSKDWEAYVAFFNKNYSNGL